jgi:hypothetical protein
MTVTAADYTVEMEIPHRMYTTFKEGKDFRNKPFFDKDLKTSVGVQFGEYLEKEISKQLREDVMQNPEHYGSYNQRTMMTFNSQEDQEAQPEVDDYKIAILSFAYNND